jgi:hypothetical protein
LKHTQFSVAAISSSFDIVCICTIRQPLSTPFFRPRPGSPEQHPDLPPCPVPANREPPSMPLSSMPVENLKHEYETDSEGRAEYSPASLKVLGYICKGLATLFLLYALWTCWFFRDGLGPDGIPTYGSLAWSRFWEDFQFDLLITIPFLIFGVWSVVRKPRAARA